MSVRHRLHDSAVPRAWPVGSDARTSAVADLPKKRHTPPCRGCGLPLLETDRACPRCGQPRGGRS